jgi:hypothetical protein
MITTTEEGDKDFSLRDLEQPYLSWKSLVEKRKPTLDKEVKEWLWKWEMHDLACSPMDDNERRFTRVGHYLGWFSRGG